MQFVLPLFQYNCHLDLDTAKGLRKSLNILDVNEIQVQLTMLSSHSIDALLFHLVEIPKDMELLPF